MGKSATSYKKGQSGNLKGRPKSMATQKDLLKAFNNNYKEIADIFSKYLDYDQEELNKALKNSGKKGSKLKLKEMIAIRFVYETVKKGHTGKLDFIISIVTGTYNDGLHEVIEGDLDGKEWAQRALMQAQSEECRQFCQLSSSQLAFLVVDNADSSTSKLNALDKARKNALRIEMSRIENVPRKFADEIYKQTLDAVKSRFSQLNPRAFMDFAMDVRRIMNESYYELYPGQFVIEAEPVKKTKRGRPKGSKNKK